MLFFPEFVPPTVEDLPKDVDETGGLAERERAVAEKKKAILEHMKNCSIVGYARPRTQMEVDPEEDELGAVEDEIDDSVEEDFEA
ncbi:hypothetical protein BSKO_00708 [Bryopsis sp. KO-2023]|nr:hypothetical protein BSKO_00708 [Bryopsis sp. KO-2023]